MDPTLAHNEPDPTGQEHPDGDDGHGHPGTPFQAYLLALIPGALFVFFWQFLELIGEGETIFWSIPWVPSLDIQLSFMVDGLSLLFSLLITGIGTLIVIYAGGYLAGDSQLLRFQVILLAFLVSMLGVVLADDVITLFVFWELTSFTSYLLIGFEHEDEKARKAALQALLVTGLGGLALLAGFVLLAQIGGTYSIAGLTRAAGHIQSHPFYFPALLLVLAGAFTKSAQFPFHFWLPNAMAAPTPASAYLHAATMVKAGVYLLARLSPMLGGRPEWSVLLVLFGGLTMVLGAGLGVRQTVFKRLLAYSTVSSLGVLVLLIGIGTDAAAAAAVSFLLAHACYKGGLFLAAGAVDHQTGKKDITQVGGLGRRMPLTALGAILAALSMGGVPPLLGFPAKELFYEAAAHAPAGAVMLTAAAVLTGLLFLAMAILAGIYPFVSPAPKAQPEPREASINLWLPVLALGGVSLALGLFPAQAERWLLGPAASAIRAAPVKVHLGLWHGFSGVLLLSLFSLVMGVAVFRSRERVREATWQLERLLRRVSDDVYDWILAAMMRLAEAQTRILQNGYLKYYLMTTLGTAGVLASYAFITRTRELKLSAGGWPHLHEAALLLTIFLAAMACIRLHSRLATIACLGVVGYGVALVFALFGAPDLAMTQLLIETLTVVLFVLVLNHLPSFAQLSSRNEHLRDGAVAILAGGFMTVVTLAAINVDLARSIAHYYGETSYHLAHGRNIVNVILVDFRGIDTMGEITVLTIAALGVFALLKLKIGPEERH